MTDGQPFDLNKTYQVALNSYRGSGGGSHLSKGAGLSKDEVAKRLIRSSETDFRFLLTRWIRKQGTITPASAHNWKTIPESWTAIAAARDAQRLFSAK